MNFSEFSEFINLIIVIILRVSLCFVVGFIVGFVFCLIVECIMKFFKFLLKGRGKRITFCNDNLQPYLPSAEAELTNTNYWYNAKIKDKTKVSLKQHLIDPQLTWDIIKYRYEYLKEENV